MGPNRNLFTTYKLLNEDAEFAAKNNSFKNIAIGTTKIKIFMEL